MMGVGFSTFAFTFHGLCELSRYFAQELDEADCDVTRVIYWYHPDYLGNTEYITDWSGNPYQYFWYSPWGESLEDQHKYQSLANPPYDYYDSPYAFNAKECDFETGNYYYGARYYNPKYSIWLSVDPKAHWYPAHSPYNYTLNNPVNLIDPNGKWVEGAGFWNNLFNNDDKAQANKIARQHKNAEVMDIGDGNYKVVYRSENKEKTVGNPDVALDQSNQIFIFKNTKRYGVYKSLAHMLDANFDNWMDKNMRSGLSTWNKIGEYGDQVIAPKVAKTAGNIAMIWNPVLSVTNATTTMSIGKDLKGQEQEGIWNRAVRPLITIFAPITKQSSLLNQVDNQLNVLETGGTLINGIKEDE